MAAALSAIRLSISRQLLAEAAKRRKMNFASDNTAGAHPRVLEAILAANTGVAGSYGADPWSAKLDEMMADWFGREVFTFPVATGGAANALALSQLAPPWSAIFCHREGHINVDECGAPEFYTSGAKLVCLDGAAARISPESLRIAALDHPAGVVHRIQPGAVSITQSTECGAVYTPDEVAAIAGAARALGMPLHMDGARFANALAHLACAPADITWRAGVEALSLGFTKNGAIAAEAVVFFDEARAADFIYRRKRGGHLFSKMRFFAAQFVAMLDSDLWLELATASNGAASALARVFEAAGYRPEFPVQANEVFVRLPRAAAADLKDAGARFYPWGPEVGEAPLYRFVCSFATGPDEVELLGNRLKLNDPRS
jgi:threonine aldolase